MALAANATERIELLTSVTIAFPRSPMVLAMEAWDIQRLSKGRFNIGLGSQVKGHNERRFGGTWSAAAPRMKEYIQMMKASLGFLAGRQAGGLHRQAVPLYPDDTEFQSGTHRLSESRKFTSPWWVRPWREWRGKWPMVCCLTAAS